MLILCPECELQVSDKAISCPHCGYPLKPDKISKHGGSKKRMRLPNGFGQITEIKGRNLRNRYRTMVTIGKTEYGKPIQKMLKPRAYFPTYKEAYEALLEYHKNPYEIDRDLTVEQVYEKWMAKMIDEATPSDQSSHNDSLKQYRNAWQYCDSIKNMKIKDIRTHHIKDCVNEGQKIIDGVEIEASPQIKSKIKVLFDVFFDYAYEYEYVNKNYARAFKLPKNIKKDIDDSLEHHMVFTDEELSVLWKNTNNLIVRLILIQCYMGWRPQELCKLKVEDVHLDEKYIVGGMKTENGRDRIVPIHPRIENIIVDCLAKAKSIDSPYLFVMENQKQNKRLTPLVYNRYYKNFVKTIESLGLSPEHKPHDGRKTFATAAKKADVNEYAIKRIIGHAITDITEAIYTDRSIDWLYEEICKIP